jgi:hypothetical protein
MQRWLSALLVVCVLALAAVLASKSLPSHPRPLATDPARPVSDGEAETNPAETRAKTDASAVGSVDRVGGSVWVDGTPVPPLPDKAPSKVRIGVVLVTYAGAQGAPDHARSQKEARDMAEKLALDARSDFHAAVVRGDNGSIDDVGTMPRGVMEPGVQYVVFMLPVGGVSDVLDTPRGYWIVKRIE